MTNSLALFFDEVDVDRFNVLRANQPLVWSNKVPPRLRGLHLLYRRKTFGTAKQHGKRGKGETREVVRAIGASATSELTTTEHCLQKKKTQPIVHEHEDRPLL